MKKNIVFWNPWWQNKGFEFNLIDRDFFISLEKLLNRKEVLFFTGVRRSGKSSTMFHLIENLLTKEKISPENILYLNMDDEVLSFSKLSEIYEQYKELHPEVTGKKFILLDEIQNVEDWERWVKNIYDSFEDVKFIISGSKSYVLKKQSTLLTGRILEFEIYPLSFKEFLDFKGIDYSNKVWYISNSHKIKFLMKEYVKFGGFPEVTLEKDEHIKMLLAKEYYENIKDKDIVNYFDIKESKKFDRLSLFLISNISKQMSANKLGKLVNLSPSVVNNYIDYAEMMYLFLPLHHFNYSLKGQITKPRKIYSIDTGLTNSIAFQFSENIGKFIENIVFLQLKRLGSEIYYYDDKNECDFIIKEGLDIAEVIQVCYKLTYDNLKREQNGLLEAMKKFNLREGTIIVLEDSKIEVKDSINIVKLEDWLLEQNF